MYNCQEWAAYLQQLHGLVQTQNQRIRQLEQVIRQLQNEKIPRLENSIMQAQSEISELKQKPATTIERIEYKFDQLKVETLEGTLNIGLAPGGNGSDLIDDFSVGQNGMQSPAQAKQPIPAQVPQAIESEVRQYLDESGQDLISRHQEELGQAVDDHYRQYMIDDIKKQLNQRVYYYLNQIPPSEFIGTANVESLMETTVNKIKNDIDQAILAFIKNIPFSPGGAV